LLYPAKIFDKLYKYRKEKKYADFLFEKSSSEKCISKKERNKKNST
jgi:hypothetical protein